MGSELSSLVLRAALFAGLAILIVLATRRPLRRWLGAAVAYQAWLIVPIVAAASLLPGRPGPALQSVQVLRPAQALAAHITTPLQSGQADALLLAWACGAAAMALWFFRGHRAFLRKAGRLTRLGAVYVSAGSAGPASVGLFRPRIVVPHDFATRYSPSAQLLVIAHEQVHIDRGDAGANLTAALFQCLFWFNPLVHLGARRFRQDQELACDAAVMRRHPHQRRAYAEALLTSHTGAFTAAGIHCHWQTQHPTKERVMSLQQTPPGQLRRLAGRCTLALLVAGGFFATLGVRAAQPAATPKYAVALEIKDAGRLLVPLKLAADSFQETGKQSLPRVLTSAGEKFSVSSGEWRLDMVVSPANTPETVWLAGKLFKGTTLVTAPKLLARIGEAATVRVGDGDKDFSMAMTVTSQP
jgi:beta-lactamase regulating signal transducer with metallopeptidase domain